MSSEKKNSINTITLLHFNDPENPQLDECDNIKWQVLGRDVKHDSLVNFNNPFNNSYSYRVTDCNKANHGLMWNDTNKSLASGSFTIEGWFYFTYLGDFQQIFGVYRDVEVLNTYKDAKIAGFRVATTVNKVLTLIVSVDGKSWAINGNYGTMTANKWYHVCAVRDNNYIYGFLNGTQKFKIAFSSSLTIYSNSTEFYLGTGGLYSYSISDSYNYLGRYLFYGYMSEFRISKIARYTSNFTPSTVPFEVD